MSKWLSSKIIQLTNLSQNVEKENPHIIPVRKQIDEVTMENNLEIVKNKNQKLKTVLTHAPAIPLLSIHP